MITATNTISTLICLENLLILILNGDFSSFTSLRFVAILPISVSTPVPTTTHVALPVITELPENTILVLSPKDAPSFTAVSSFVAFILSPVSNASSTVKLEQVIILISALILSPLSKNTISPGTS